MPRAGKRWSPTRYDAEEERLRLSFRLHVDPSDPLSRMGGWELHDGVVEFLQQFNLFNDVADVFRRGGSIFFVVPSHAAAEDIVWTRSCLKGTGFAIFDVLTIEEQQQKDVLWPLYQRAIREGKKAQFFRGRLRVEGKWVKKG